ncbi:hypothetical protein TSUD_211930 [Trifolium subterraneum]|uniref:Uncharacterized protein n=1 Tax=Trifolium subterraneum TaxID=3900 RepID=A0A2Z6MCB0_TRISU|nr:hypothetical protein TSUD_211930 [Trifolium subterraneum]
MFRRDFSEEELVIVVHDKYLKLNDSEPTEVRRLKTEARPVQVHIVIDPLVLSSTGSEVDYVPNGVAAEQQEVAEESIVATMSIIAEEHQDVVRNLSLMLLVNVK